MPGPSLGTNLHALVDWSTAFPFVDLFRMSRPWYTQSEGAFDTGQADLLELDSAGWVKAFTQDGSPAPFERVATLLFTGGHVPAGTYVLEWEGEGSIDLGLIPGDAIVRRGDHSITFRLEEGDTLQIALTETDPEGVGNYLRNLQLYNRQDADLIAAGQVFAPEFLEKIADFRVLRFMDWMSTNNSKVTEWDDTRPGGSVRETDYDTDAQGASVETMVAVANQVKADAWFNIPHGASDDYIRTFATYVRDHLADGLVARFEFSNEVWNWGFDQTHYAQAQAEALWGAGVEGGWMQWYGMRAAQMAEIVAEVFGTETGTRALNVFATQAGWQGLEGYALDAADFVAAGGTPPRDAPFHIYAIAPYFGGSIGSGDYADLVNDWIAAGESGFAAAIDFLRHGDVPDSLAHIGESIAYHAGVAQALGWQLEAYEGGQHIVDLDGLFGGEQDPEQTAFFVDLVKRPEFQDLYAEYFQIWKDNGGGLMAQFSDFGAGDQYGSWGIWDSAYAEDSPRALAVKAFRDGVAAWWADDRPSETFENGAARVDREGDDVMQGTARGDILVALAGNNSVDGAEGDDLLTAGAGDDGLSGGAGDDVLTARGGADGLLGGKGRDVLNGGDGADVLTGGRGADLLSGGLGADRFIFTETADSAVGAGDSILDFQRGHDQLDISALGGGQALVWRASRAFSGSGVAELRIERPNGDQPLMVQIDENGDGATDLEIMLVGTGGIGIADLLL
ncbi:Hemolysin-type calcium-binding repeat-containing protein [Gemmobacter aquatilis]|uniref:Hemolysin-type calcium-binding repeat-containing protein n=1 Tax=Gemmobacter aquatilis TaxID=933059 RepID=A0A1H8BUP4_9RHOB|nr:calcium-binding protein [Gemmobacter aquatilis]SEM86621.1 Hemolysin-type calcium-binding repeat-containing protein [Gemmobacter aquatilis]